MNQFKSAFLACAIVAGLLPLARLSAEDSHENFGREKAIYDFTRIEIKNTKGEILGRISDLGIDLVNGRIVEVLVTSDSSLKVDNKVVAVPPGALKPDQLNQVYTLDVSPEVFKTAAAIDMKNWNDAGRSDRVAATYHLFGQETYFREEDAAPSSTAGRPKVSLGYVERSRRIIGLPVGNFQGLEFGKVWSLTLDIPHGRILNVIILAPGNFMTKSIVPAMALSFNAERNSLLLDDTKDEYADEPRYIYTEAAYGQPANSHEETYKGPRTSVALEQGSSYRDIDRTVRIFREVRAARVDSRNVEIATLNGRVTLRGWVRSEEAKTRINAIAVGASQLELVDNQITVGNRAVLKY